MVARVIKPHVEGRRSASPAIAAVDRVNVTPCARAMSRLIVLPFRVLRPDPKTDFLAFSQHASLVRHRT
jgi:hypothetical protein